MKKRLLTRLIPVLLTAVLLLTLPAGAVSHWPAHGETVVEAGTSLPDIEVRVPATGEVFINPWGLPVQVGASTERDQVISSPNHIQNLTVAPVSVTVAVTGKIWEGSTMKLGVVSTKGSTSIIKMVFMYLEIKAVDNPSAVAWDDEYDAAKHLVVRNEITRTMKNMVILGAGGEGKDYGAFRLTGDCVEEPRNPWNEEVDGVDVTIAFTFKALHIDTEVP